MVVKRDLLINIQVDMVRYEEYLEEKTLAQVRNM